MQEGEVGSEMWRQQRRGELRGGQGVDLLTNHSLRPFAVAPVSIDKHPASGEATEVHLLRQPRQRKADGPADTSPAFHLIPPH